MEMVILMILESRQLYSFSKEKGSLGIVFSIFKGILCQTRQNEFLLKKIF